MRIRDDHKLRKRTALRKGDAPWQSGQVWRSALVRARGWETGTDSRDNAAVMKK
jgi:hypothetical protein